MIKKAFNRRMLLRSAPAAALAAPTLAQGASQSFGAPIGVPLSGDIAKTSANGDWIAQHKARLLDVVAGKRDPERELYDRQHLDFLDAHRLDSLRSLSPVVRARMHAESSRKRRDQIELESAKITLDKIAKGLFR